MAGKEKTILQLDGEINLKADKAKQSMQELKNLLNEFKNKTIDVKAQTRSARMSIQNLGDFISRTFNRENVVKLSTADAQAKADRLLNTLRSFKDFTKITLSLDAKGVSSQLQSIRNNLNFITGKHTISLNATTAQVKSQLAGLSKDINNIKNVSFTINVKNNADLKGINTFTKDMSKLAGLKSDITFGITVKSVQNSLDRVRQVSNVLANLKNNNSIQFTETGLRPILGKLKNMELYLRSIKQNSKIKISAEGAKELPKLKVQADQTDLFAVEKRLAIITNQIRRINRMTLRVNTSYNNRSGGGGGSRGGGSGGTVGGDRWYNSSDATQFIHFLGRSSKGLGSFGEALADVLAKGNAAGGSLSKLTGSASIAAATIGGMLAAGNLLIGAINTLASALGSMAQLVATALKPGFELMAQRDTTMLTTKAALKTSATVNGRAVTNEEATAESAYLFSRAMQEAAKTVLNLNDILTAQQGVLPMLLNKGMTPKQAQDVIFGVAGVAKTGRLAPNQVLQETRDLAQGSITARTSQVANILGITNQDLAQFKGNVDALYEYLMKKFQEYTKVMEEYANTPVGAIEQLQETWGIAAMTIVDEYGPLIVETAQTITKSLGQFDEQGNFHLSDWLKELADGLLDIVVYATSCADALLNMIQSIVGGSDPIETMVNFIKDMIGALTTLIGTLLGVIKIFKMLWAVMKSGVSLIEGLVKGFIGLTQAFLGWVNAKLGNESKANEYAESSKTFLNESKNAFYAFSDVEGQYNNTIDIGWTGNKKTNGFDTYLGESGKLTKKVLDLIDRARNRDIPKGRDVPGMRGTAQDKEDEKARKKALQEAKKAMKDNIKALKEVLKDHIADLKDTLEKNKIAYDEGFMSLREYLTQKAAIEREEAEATLEEAQAEKAEILATPYEKEEDRLRDLREVNRTIKNAQKSLDKSIVAQNGVAKVIKQYATSFENVGKSHDIMYRTQLGQPVDLSNISGMSNTEVAYRFLTSQGFNDAISQGIIASLKGESLSNPKDVHVDSNSKLFGGIASWNGERFEALKNFAAANNSDWQDIRTQLAFLVSEIQKGGSEAENFAKALQYFNETGKTAEAMVEAWTKFIERPNDIVGEANARKRFLPEVSKELQASSNRQVQVSQGNPTSIYDAIQTALTRDNYLGQTLKYGTVACVEAATKLGAYFSTTLAEAVEKGIVNTDALDLFLNRKDVGWIDFSKANLEPGDLIFFDGYQQNQHVMIYQGNNTVTGNFSSRNGGNGAVGQQDLDEYLQYSGLTPTHIRKTSRTSVFGNLGSPIQDMASQSKEEAEARKLFQEALEKLRQSDVDVEGLQLGKYVVQLSKLEAEKLDKLKSTEVNKYEGADRDRYIQNVEFSYRQKSADLLIKVFTEQAEYNLEKIEEDWADRSIEMSLGNIPVDKYSYWIEKYADYFYGISGGGTEDGIWGVFNLINKITEQAKVYLKDGNLKAYRSAMTEVKKLRQKYNELIKSSVDDIKKPFDTALDLFNTSDKYTPLQREYGERQIKSWQAQAEVTYWEGYIKTLRSVKQGLIDTKAPASELLKIDKELWDASMAKEKAKLIAEQYPNYLRDLKKVSKDALEDGLVTFLTDGINEAENLGEALRNLAIGILKEIQKFSAQRMVKSLMDKWFGGYEVDNPQTLHRTNADIGMTSAEVAADIESGARAIASAMWNAANIISNGSLSTNYTVSGVTRESLVPGNNMLNLSYDEYMENKTNPYKFNPSDYEISGSVKAFKSSIDDFKLSTEFNAQASNNLAQVNTALNATTQSNTVATQADATATQVNATATQTQTAQDTVNTAQEVAVRSQGNIETARNNALLQQQNTQGAVNQGMAVTGGGSGGGDAVATGAAGVGSSAVAGFKGLGGGGFLNTPFFQKILGVVTDISGSALGQLAGDFLAIRSIFKGDTKEKLLGTIFLELQLLYMGQQQLIIWAQMAANWLQEIAFEIQNLGMGVNFATGGYISGPGTSTSDSIPTMLSNGEYVIKASSVRKYGTNFLNAVNSGNFTKIRSGIPHYAQGGLVSDLAQEQTARGISNFGKDISNNISNTANISVALVRDEQEGMKQLLRSPEGQRIMLDFSRKYASVTSRF